MIWILCLIMEALSILLCIHGLYGKKFKLNLYNGSLIFFDIILYSAINEEKVNQYLQAMIYFLILLYCVLEFGLHLKMIVMNTILMFIIIGIAQLLCSIPVLILETWMDDYQVRALLINSLVLLIFIMRRSRMVLKQLSDYMVQKDWLYRIIVFLCFLSLGYSMFKYKNEGFMQLWDYAIITSFAISIFLLTMQWQKSKSESRLKTLEIKMLNGYNRAFEELLEAVRSKQHNFDNQITAIYSQHANCSTYEELVKVQREYCEKVEESNKFNKLLLGGNSIIIGYLYGKFIEIDKKGIAILYQVSTKELACRVPSYEMVEIIGILVDNAVEAVISNGKKKWIGVTMIEKEEGICISIKNPGDYMKQSEAEKCFVKGYSSKGEGRGLGLARVKEICNKYDCSIFFMNEKEGGDNIIVFQVCI